MTAGSCEIVGIHRHDRLVALVEGSGEAVSIRRAETELAGPAKHLDPTELRGGPLGECCSAVGAVVVDHQHVGIGHRLAHGAQEPDDVLGLVEGRQHDDGTHGLRA